MSRGQKLYYIIYIIHSGLIKIQDQGQLKKKVANIASIVTISSHFIIIFTFLYQGTSNKISTVNKE